MSTSWMQRTNVYEVNLRQYTREGTINAFCKHFPRLKDMGIETLWFMPITPISKKNRKGSMGSYYACADYTLVAEEFGTIEDWKTLVRTAHEMGFKVIMDWVANHTGWDHVWTVDHPEWYQHDAHTGDFKMASGMEDIIELNFDNAEMRKAMVDAMKFWVVETGIDGFRCDLAFWVRLDFWQQAKAALEPMKKVFWLGELDVLEHNAYMQVFDTGYTWQWMHQTAKFCRGEIPFSDLLETLDRYQHAKGNKLWFTTNHDENSWNGTEYEKYGPLANGLMVFSCTWPGIPLIYSGQEIPNEKRLEFFEKDPLNWSNGCRHHSFFKLLLSWRRQYEVLLSGDVHIEPHDRLLAFTRLSTTEEWLVLINFSNDLVTFHLQDHWRSREEMLTLDVTVSGQTVELKPYGFLVIKKNSPTG